VTLLRGGADAAIRWQNTLAMLVRRSGVLWTTPRSAEGAGGGAGRSSGEGIDVDGGATTAEAAGATEVDAAAGGVNRRSSRGRTSFFSGRRHVWRRSEACVEE
jgi:hypothetical protein